MTRRNCVRCLLIVFLAVAGCSAVQNPAVAYTPPASTPYARKPLLEQQYLRAHKAGWTSVVLAFSPADLKKAIGGNYWSSSDTTCCEATQNVTRGWYQGEDDAEQFLHALATEVAYDPSIVPAYAALHKALQKSPPVQWYVADLYDPKKLTNVVEDDGALRIEKTYRDETKRTLFKVERYRAEVLDGDEEEYDANGELSTVTPYKNGQVDGLQRGYSDTGALSGTVPYVQGMKQGAGLWYNESRRANRLHRVA